MSEMVVAHPVSAGWGRRLAWGLGAVVVGGIVPSVLILFAIGAGMFVVAALGFGEAWGVPTYLVLMAVASCVYAGMLYGTIRLIGPRVEVPWLVWLALLVAPVAGLLMTGPLVDPTDVLANPMAAPALIGIAIAYVALGKRRWTEVA